MSLALTCFALAAVLKVIGWAFGLGGEDTRIPDWIDREQDEPWPECFDEMEDL